MIFKNHENLNSGAHPVNVMLAQACLLKFYGHGQAVRKGFEANLWPTRHSRPFPPLEFTCGDVLRYP